MSHSSVKVIAVEPFLFLSTHKFTDLNGNPRLENLKLIAVVDTLERTVPSIFHLVPRRTVFWIHPASKGPGVSESSDR